MTGQGASPDTFPVGVQLGGHAAPAGSILTAPVRNPTEQTMSPVGELPPPPVQPHAGSAYQPAQQQQPYQPQPQYQAPAPVYQQAPAYQPTPTYTAPQYTPAPPPQYQPAPVAPPSYAPQVQYGPAPVQPAAPPPAFPPFSMGGERPMGMDDDRDLFGSPTWQQQQPAPVAPMQPQQPVDPVAARFGQSTQIRDALGSLDGLDVSGYQSDAQLIKDFADIAAKNAQYEQYVPYMRLGYDVATQNGARGGQPQVQAPAQAAPTQQPAPAAPGKLQKPEFRPEWEGEVRLDPSTGRYVGSHALANPHAVEAANALAAYRKQKLEQVLDYEPPSRDEIKAEVLQEIRVENERTTRAEQARQILADQADRFFLKAPTGQYQQDPVSGQYVMSQEGQRLWQLAGDYNRAFKQQYGHEPEMLDTVTRVLQQMDNEAAVAWARQMQAQQQPQPPQQGYYPPQPQQQVAQYQQPAYQPQQIQYAQPQQPQYGQQPPAYYYHDQQRKDDLIRRQAELSAALHQPSAGGPAQMAASPYPQEDFKTSLFREAAARGLPVGVL